MRTILVSCLLAIERTPRLCSANLLVWLPLRSVLSQAFSRAALAAAWVQQPLFLKQQLALWLNQQQRHVLDSMWSQLLQQAAAVAVAAAAGSGTSVGSGKAAAPKSASRTDSDRSLGKKRKKAKAV
jgi:fatty acid-binding protein DegV